MSAPVILFLCALALCVGGVLGFLFGALLRRPTNDDSDLLDFLEQTGYSVQCVNSLWAVTDGSRCVVGTPATEVRTALQAAAGHVDSVFSTEAA